MFEEFALEVDHIVVEMIDNMEKGRSFKNDKKNVVKLTVSLVAFIAELLIRLMSMEESGKTNNFMKSSVMTAAEEGVASERSIGCIQGKAFPDGEALNTSKVVTQTKQSNTRTGPNQTDEKGARPKGQTTQKTHTTKKEAETEAIPMPDVPPILREELRQNKQVRNTNSADTPIHGKTRREMKLANYDGTSEWSDFKSHFDACVVINNWDDQEKGLYLATALRGQAQGVFSDLPTEKRMDYTTA
ncbi:unnamed protein product [Mytilus edulis]|uniref:Uncharacterized protein n=1 Tax=Mytilus edulis TaxID=6550 RepID=A0A8S3S549_MYTED|nr:unnamed protein product [Mytilus edulis]